MTPNAASAPQHATRIASVTAGPAAEIRKSTPGVVGSRVSFASPPKNHSSMLDTPIPLRRATSACPSSWRTSDTKNSTAPMTATT